MSKEPRNPQNRIVITGVGMVSSLGIGVDEFHNGVKNGNSGLIVKREFVEEGIKEAFCYPSPTFKIKDHFEGLRPPFPLRYSQLAMLGCLDAVKDAGLPIEQESPDRIGLILNTSLAASAAVEKYLEKLFRKGPRKASPFSFTKTVSNSALGDVTRKFKFRGSSSLLLGENSATYGYDLLRRGDADIIVCGGFDEIRDQFMMGHDQHDKLVDCSANTETDSSEVNLKRALDNDPQEDRTIIGEGSAFVVLETLSHAQERGAEIYAEIVNYESAFDEAYDQFVHERSTADIAYSINGSLANSGVQFSEIDAVVGASGLPWQFNAYEGPALAEQTTDKPVYYTSVKPFIGETFGASGQASIIAGALMLKHQSVYGTGFFADYIDTPDNLTVPSETLDNVPLNQILVNCIHCGGNNTALVLRKWEN